VIEALKLAFNLLIRYRSAEDVPRPTQRRTALWDASRDFEEQPLQGLASQDREETAVSARGVIGQDPTDAWPTMRSWLAVVSASVVWASVIYIVRLYWIAEECLMEGISHSLPLPCFSLTL